MNDLKNKVIWLSGASSGIGKALATELTKRGVKLVLSGRNTKAMKAIAPNAEVMHCDVTSKNEWQHCCEAVKEKYGHLDIFIYNSGTCEYPDPRQFSTKSYEDIFAINYFGLLNGLEATLPLLRQSKSPHIVGMSSIVSLLALPRAHAYGSSKAAVTYFLESLRFDLASENFDISIIMPGFVDTPLTQKNDFAMPFIITPEKAANYIIKGIEKRQPQICFPKRFTYIIKILALLPRKLQYKITKRFKKS